MELPDITKHTAAATNEDIEEYVFRCLYENDCTLQQICDGVSMTEDELRAIPAVNELLNK